MVVVLGNIFLTVLVCWLTMERSRESGKKGKVMASKARSEEELIISERKRERLLLKGGRP